MKILEPREDLKVRKSAEDKYVATYDIVSGGLEITTGGNVVLYRCIDGIGITPNSEDMRALAEDALLSEGYGTNRPINGRFQYVLSKPLEMQKIDTSKNFRKLYPTYEEIYYNGVKLGHVDTNPLGITMTVPYATKTCFYNMANTSLAFKCRFSFIMAWLKYNYADNQFPIWKDIKAVVAENSFNFKALDSKGSVREQYCVRKMPYNFANKQGMFIYEGYEYVVGKKYTYNDMWKGV